MNYEQAIEWIHNRLKFGIKPGVKRMEWFMEKLGHPENKLQAIHIAGTNGKGSTLSFLRQMLQEHGYSVGTFTSPYIVRFNERISVNGVPLEDDYWIELVEKVKPLAEELEQTALGTPTEFEVITAMAFKYFADNPVDFVIFETGLGGRFDSTNIVKPKLSIITNIGMDHTSILGDTLEEIAFEKAGIIKKGVPVISGVTQPDALAVIKAKAEEQAASLYQLGEQFFALDEQSDDDKKETFSLKFQEQAWCHLDVVMKGKHQISNASLAIMGLKLLEEQSLLQFDNQKMRSGLINTFWPGRFEVVSRDPLVIIDGAHNNEGMEALLKTLQTSYRNKTKHLIFTALQDKPVGTMIKDFATVFETVTFTSFDFPRASKAESLYDQSNHPNKFWEQSWQTAIRMKLADLTDDNMLIITGSLYFISEVRSFFEEFSSVC